MFYDLYEWVTREKSCQKKNNMWGVYFYASIWCSALLKKLSNFS